MQFETNRHRIDTILDENLMFLIFICKKRSSSKVKKFPIFDKLTCDKQDKLIQLSQINVVNKKEQLILIQHIY